MILVTDSETYMALSIKTKFHYYDIEALPDKWPEIRTLLADGESMCFIGTKHIEVLEEIWVWAADGALSENAVVHPLPCGPVPPTSPSPCKSRYLYARPPHRYAQHGVDEHPRMEIIPLVSNYDRYGSFRGSPAMLYKNSDQSLTGGRFKGSFWFIWAFDKPLEAWNACAYDLWLESALRCTEHHFFISRLNTEYPLYYQNESVRIDYRVTNCLPIIRSYTAIFKAFGAHGDDLGEIGYAEEAINGNDSLDGWFEWYPEKTTIGVCHIRMELYLTDRFQYGQKRESECCQADVSECAVIIKSPEIEYPKVEAAARGLRINGEESFFTGTHLYPSSTFFELGYRDMDVLRLEAGIKHMRDSGIKICRIWSAPLLDECSLRGMEACLDLFGSYGICVIFTFFTSWTHKMEIRLEGISKRFEVASLDNDRLIGLYLNNMAEQKLFVSLLAKRWRGMSHIIWDFSNEFSVVDPTGEEGKGADWLDPKYKNLPPTERENELFRQWAAQIDDALKCSDAKQLRIFGATCWDTGTDNYRCSKNADIIVDHNYYGIDEFLRSLYLSNASCTNKPNLLEEFGGLWPDIHERAEEYDGRYHYSLGAGMTGAITYEWGVLWLSERFSGMPCYLRFWDGPPPKEAPVFIFNDRFTYGHSFHPGSTGLCPWMASFEYGSIYSCTQTPTPATERMERAARLGQGLATVPFDASVFVVMPHELNEYNPGYGYKRKTDAIMHTLQLLMENGVEFSIWQMDALNTMPYSAQIVIYPTEVQNTAEEKIVCEAALMRGAAFYAGDSDNWLADPMLKKLSFSVSTRTVNAANDKHKPLVMFRRVASGLLCIFDMRSNELSTICTDRIRCDMRRFGSYLQTDQGLTLAEVCGRLEYDGEFLLETTGKCLVRSLNGQTIQSGKCLSLFPYECCSVSLAGRYSCAEVIAHDGIIRGEIPVMYQDSRTTIEISTDELLYEIRLH